MNFTFLLVYAKQDTYLLSIHYLLSDSESPIYSGIRLWNSG